MNQVGGSSQEEKVETKVDPVVRKEEKQQLHVSIKLDEKSILFFKMHPDLAVHSINLTKQTASLCNKSNGQPIPAVNFFEKVSVTLN